VTAGLVGRRLLLAAVLASSLGAAVAQPAESSPLPGLADPDRIALGTAPPTVTEGHVSDPWESFNRSMFAVNEVLDADLLFPLASAYVGLVPELVRQGVSNVFNNFQDAWSAVNNLLQGKLEQSTVMTMRFAWNSVFGVAGILDMATELGLERTPEDFGQTLGVWGFAPGNYLVLPFFGPSTVRDAIGLPLDIAASPAWAINQGSFRPATTVLQILDTRSQFMGASQLLDSIALDKYSFVRNAFLARRMNLVFDGNPPEDYDVDVPAPAPAKP
jgi:phospholipid-binding lipoprotein MlaA